MEEYKQRMIIEYRELKERAEKLATMLDKWDKGTLDFAPACPKYLLDKQLETMRNYIGILQTRAEFEHVDLIASVDAYMPAEKSGWIPVSERLPESSPDDLEYPTVLGSFSDGSVQLVCYYESTKEWGGGEYFDMKRFPVAWMPLPKPYEGGKE